MTPTPSKLRILHVNSILSGGGTDEFCVRLAAGLKSIGEQVWLAGPPNSRYVPMITQAELGFHPAARGNNFRFAWNVAQVIRREKIQVVHAHHGRDYWPTVFGAHLSGLGPKVIISRHLAKSPGSWASRRFLLSQCDAFIAVSQFVARVLREGHFEPDAQEEERRARVPMSGDLEKIHVVYGGVDTNRFFPLTESTLRKTWNLEPEHFAFGVVGVYNKPRGKGQREFLQAAARIHQKIPHARFLIIGAGDLAQTLRDDIARLGLSEKAWLTSFCNDMPQGMNALDCLVHPAVGTEALALAVCEATACGRPVIASDLDGIPEALVDPSFGTLVKPDSVDALEKAMLHWASQPKWSFNERKRAHAKLAERFSMSAAAERYCDLYESLF